jgi:DNA-binding response OmpR family regulator
VDEKRLGFSLGAAEYIVKPIEKDVLLRKLKNLSKLSKIKRILVVDNEPEAVKLIGGMLVEAGYQVTKVYGSKEAIDTMKESKPDLVVLTLTMPEVSGADVIEYMKTAAEVKHIPLIVVTHRDLSEGQITELNGRIQGILNKGSLTPEELLKEFREIIGKCDRA